MAENESSTIPKSSDEDNHSRIDSERKNSNSLASKLCDENSKKHKSSFLSQFRKRFSFHKKAKSKEIPLNNGNNNNTPIKQKESILPGQQNDLKSEKNNSIDSGKQGGRFSVIRRSFGRGKNKENSPSKEVGNLDQSKNRDSMSQNQNRPQSMHIANSYPPRNGLLASFGWYWGPLSRSEATHRLRHQDDGSFLVRDSEGDPNKFTLSFKGSGQIFHNRILQHQNKYAFLPDEEFDSIPDLINDAMRRSATSAYCFSRSTDVVATNPVTGTIDGHNVPDGGTTINGNGTVGNSSSSATNHKHEVRLLQPVSRFTDSPRSLFYLCRFMIRQYTRFQDLCKLMVNAEIMLYLEDSKYNL